MRHSMKTGMMAALAWAALSWGALGETVVDRQGDWLLRQTGDGAEKTLWLESKHGGAPVEVARTEVPTASVTETYWDEYAGDGGAWVTEEATVGGEYEFRAFLNAGKVYWEDRDGGTDRLWTASCKDPAAKTLLAEAAAAGTGSAFGAKRWRRGAVWATADGGLAAIDGSGRQVPVRVAKANARRGVSRDYDDSGSGDYDYSGDYDDSGEYDYSGTPGGPQGYDEYRLVDFDANGGLFVVEYWNEDTQEWEHSEGEVFVEGGEFVTTFWGDDLSESETYLRCFYEDERGLVLPTWAGHAFDGWYLARQGGEPIGYGEPVEVNDERTVYAHWVAVDPIGLAAAVDNGSLAFATGGDADWFAQTVESCPTGGGDAARSGVIAGVTGDDRETGRETWMETTVTGPGTVEFWWKASCEPGWEADGYWDEETDEWVDYDEPVMTYYDHAAFSIDGEEMAKLAGETEWEMASFEIPAGSHTLRWTYRKDEWDDSGHDCAWVDHVIWEGVGQTQTVTFNANGGTCGTGSAAYAFGEPYGELPVATKGVYPFVGWFTAKSGGEQVTAESVVPAEASRTLYARWAKNQTVTFDANGGTCKVSKKGYWTPGTYDTLPEATQEGNAFVGWYTAASGGTKVKAGDATGSATSRTLYAHWTRNQTVTFDANGGTCNVSKKGYWIAGTYATLPVAEKGAYPFVGWFTAKNGGEQVTAESVVPAISARTLYAHWAKNQTVTFNANGGTCATKKKGYWTPGTYGTLPVATRVEYAFTGWFTAASGGTQVKEGDATTEATSRTLYAHWTRNQTVTFDANGGTCATSRKGYWIAGTYATLPTATNGVKPFVGWFTAASGGEQVKVGDTVPAMSARTLYAHWAKNQAVTFNANGGTCATKKKGYWTPGTYGTLPTPTNGVKPFVGWFTAASGGTQVKVGDATTDETSRTLYAHWAKNQTVTFDANGGTCKTAKKGYWTPGTYATLPVATRDGYAFAGWFTAAEGGTQVKAGDAATSASARTLYAHWTAARQKAAAGITGIAVAPGTNGAKPRGGAGSGEGACVLLVEAQAGVEYVVQWTGVLGGEWETVKRWTAEADGEAEVEVPLRAGENGAGFYRVAGSE